MLQVLQSTGETPTHPSTHTVLLFHLEPGRCGAQGCMVQLQRPLRQPYTRGDAAAEGRAQAGPVRVACCCCLCDELLPAGRVSRQQAGRSMSTCCDTYLSTCWSKSCHVSGSHRPCCCCVSNCSNWLAACRHQLAAACLPYGAHLSVVKGFGHQAASRACTSSAPGLDSW